MVVFQSESLSLGVGFFSKMEPKPSAQTKNQQQFSYVVLNFDPIKTTSFWEKLGVHEISSCDISSSVSPCAL
jgi:hypothetical protein